MGVLAGTIYGVDMSIIRNAIGTFTGVFVSSAIGASAGCSPSYIGYSSPNYVDFDPGARLSVDSYVLVEDGDGRYDAAKDFWENLEGERVDPATDKKLEAFFKGIGIEDLSALGNFSIPAFKNYWETFDAQKTAMVSERDDAVVMERYEAIAEAGQGIGLSSAFESPLYNAVLAAFGAMGCYIPLVMAEGHADKGHMQPMEKCFAAAVFCAAEKQLEGGNFNERAAQLRRVSYISRANAIVEEVRTGKLEAAEMIARIKKLADDAESTLSKEMFAQMVLVLEEVVIVGFEAACERVLVDDAVKDEAYQGSVAELDAKLDAVEGAAREANVLGRVKPMIEQTRRTGYFAALVGIERNEAYRGEYNAMDTKLDAIMTSAKRKNLIADIGAKLRNVRKAGYLAAVEKLAASTRDPKSVNQDLNKLQNSARRYGILDQKLRQAISKARSAVRRRAK